MGGWFTIGCPMPGCTYQDDFHLEVGQETDPRVVGEHLQVLRAEHPNHLAHDGVVDHLDDALLDAAPNCSTCLVLLEVEGDELVYLQCPVCGDVWL